MMEAEKNSCMDLQLCLVHDDSTHENDPPEATKLDGSAHDSRQGTEESSSVESSQKMMADKERKDIRIRFPFKLYDILHDSKTQGREHIISWDPEGKSFKVHQPEDFVTEVMPKYFKQTKYRSFQRMVGAIIAHACTCRRGNVLFSMTLSSLTFKHLHLFLEISSS